MVGSSGINRDTADEATRAIRRERIQPRIFDRTRTLVSVLGDKHSACSCRSPQSCGIRTRAREGGHVSTSPRHSTVICSTCRQIFCASGADAHEITAVRICAPRRKLRTVGFEECLVASPILSSPDTLGSLEDPSCGDRVGNNWSVKLCAFAAGYDGTAGDDPFQRIAVLEVYIMEVPRE